MKSIKNIFLFVWLATAPVLAQDANGVFRAAGSPENPKVPIAWNRYYNYDGVTELCRKIAAAHPNLVKLSSIGKSTQGRDLWILTVTDFSKGTPEGKPAFYLDGNIHSNEIQGTEMALYTAWYLTETHKDLPYIQDMLTDRVFYIVPTINPDARDNYMKAPNNPNSPRSGMVPVDNDRDGKVNEDGFDDLDGDGHITQMIRKSPTGRFIKDPNQPDRLMMAKVDQLGAYEMLGYEGLDNDGDGRVNEDGEGFYDPNRDWGWKWQPNPVQAGAYKYPFSIIENRRVRDFVMAHPNIAGAQSFHNSGGMILRGPGAEEDLATYNTEDVRIYDAIGKKGELLIPGYRYLVVYKDLYSVFGGELDWFYGGRGIYTFTNELFTSYMYFNRPASRGEGGAPEEPYEFNQSLLFGDAIVPWKESNHPQYGKIEVGGFKKNFTRADPGFLLESDAHRNMSFCLYHAYHMPKLSVEEISERSLGNGLTEVTATIKNERLMPTHSSQDLKYKIERPDYISIGGATVIAGMVVENRDLNLTAEQKVNPAVLEVKNIPGLGSVTVRWIIVPAKNYTVRVDSRKGGVTSRSK